MKRHHVSYKAADAFLSVNTRFMQASEVDKVFKEYQSLLKDVTVKHHLEPGRIYTAAIVNWLAPCAIKSNIMELQANLIFNACLLSWPCHSAHIDAPILLQKRVNFFSPRGW